jgi:energy-coupling factor transporter ATP-binding protein EcfA2
MARKQVNSATLIMGVTGSGKSSLLYTLAVWLFANYGKILRLYTSDGGGYPAKIEEGVERGIIEVFRLLTRDPGDLGLSFETCQRAAMGWWPVRIKPATGEVSPGVAMVPPITTRYEVICPNGHVAASLPSAQLATQARQCGVCKVNVTPATTKGIHLVSRPTKGFERVGAVAYDSLTSMLAWQMRDLGHRAGRMELRGEEAAIGGKVVSGDLKFGGTTRSHVGFVQARGEELVHLTMSIPNLVVPPVFTALTHEDVDDRSLQIRGPKIAGRAKTDEAPQWFGNCLEAAKVPAVTGAGEQRVLYLDEFTDNGIRHLVKNRAAPGTMPALLMDPPEDKTHPELAFTQFNLGVFFSMLGSALAQQVAEARAANPNEPGLPEEEEVSFGEAAFTGPVVPTATATTATVNTTTAPTVIAPSTPSSPAPKTTAPRPRAKPVVVKTPPAVPVAGPATAPVGEDPPTGSAPVQQPETAAVATGNTTEPVPEPASMAVPAAPIVAGAAAATAASVPHPAPTPVNARPTMAPPPGARPPAAAPRVPAPTPRPKPAGA